MAKVVSRVSLITVYHASVNKIMLSTIELNNYKTGQLYQDRDRWTRTLEYYSKVQGKESKKQLKECNRKIKSIEKELQKLLYQQAKLLL